MTGIGLLLVIVGIILIFTTYTSSTGQVIGVLFGGNK